MTNDEFESFLWRGSNYRGGAPEVYEDTHDEYGRYIGGQKKQSSVFGTPPSYTAPSSQFGSPKPDNVPRTERELSNPPQFQYYDVPKPKKQKATPLPNLDTFLSPRLYQNIVLYAPRNAADVERLIDYMRRREPAIVDLDPISDSEDAQRVLDFTSGAVYALNGRIIEIKTNMFLIVPEGVDVAKPEA